MTIAPQGDDLSTALADHQHEVDERVMVWDFPTRFFHWSLAILVIALWFTASQGYLRAHLLCGLTLLALLLFRIVWGVVGSTTSRFTDFVYGPTKVFRYFKVLARGRAQAYAGHNPAGGLMVVTFFAILLVQAITGLFANDGVSFTGPLALQISSDLSDRVTQMHMLLFKGILVLVWMHLVAIFFYLLVKNENLIGPMLNGCKSRAIIPAQSKLEFTDTRYALIILVVVALAIAWLSL